MEVFLTAVGAVASVVFFCLVSLAFRAWALMLAVALVHALWLPHLRTLGFWWAVALVALVSVIVSPRGSVGAA